MRSMRGNVPVVAFVVVLNATLVAEVVRKYFVNSNYVLAVADGLALSTAVIMLAGITTMGLFASLYVLSSPSRPLFPAMHLFNFIAVVGVAHVASAQFQEFRFDPHAFTLVLLLLALYAFMVIALSRLGRPTFGDQARLLSAIGAIPAGAIVAMMLGGLAAKLVLLLRHGPLAFQLLSKGHEVIPYPEAAAGTLITYPALGAFWAAGAKLAMNWRAGIGQSRLLLPVWVLFWVWPLMGFGEVGGGRRFILATIILLFCVYWRAHRAHQTPMLLMVGTVAASAGLFAAFEYFQSIRANWSDPHILSLLRSGELRPTLQGLAAYLVPAGRSMAESFSSRLTSFAFLHDLTRIQMNDFTVTGGEIIRQSFHNQIPRFLGDKLYVNADEILSATYGFPQTDLAAGTLAAMQSEIFLFAYLVVPLLIMAGIAGYTRLFLWAARWSRLLSLTVFAVLMKTSAHVEESLDAFLSDLRILVPMILLSLGLHGMRVVFRLQRDHRRAAQ